MWNSEYFLCLRLTNPRYFGRKAIDCLVQDPFPSRSDGGHPHVDVGSDLRF